MDEHLRQFLAGRDVPCPGCGYNLRDLVVPRCPECAAPLTLSVNQAEPRFAGFVSGVIGLAGGTGFSGLLLVYAMIRIVAGAAGPWWNPFVTATTIGMALEGACLAGWVAQRRRLTASSASVRRLMIAACWLLTLANLATFVLLVH